MDLNFWLTVFNIAALSVFSLYVVCLVILIFKK